MNRWVLKIEFKASDKKQKSTDEKLSTICMPREWDCINRCWDYKFYIV